MAKAKTIFVCGECGYESGRWLGKCPECGAWNSMAEQAVKEEAPSGKPLKRPGSIGSAAMELDRIGGETQIRRSCGIGELDRVLGGGIVEGSATLVGGDPGIGKSTLLLQVCGKLAADGARVLYVTGEESARQIKLRADRLGVSAKGLWVLAENAMDGILERFREVRPQFLVVDSIQTVYSPEISSAPGSVSQVRECAAVLIRAVKQENCSLFLVGHVTKEGAIAGPRILEHMVDSVLYFEGDHLHAWRILRAVKNRFGSVNELGVFEMRDCGMIPVDNPSELLLSKRTRGAAGSVVTCGIQGSRPILVDVQALVSRTPFGMPRRMADGVDGSRLALLLAVLEKRAGLRLYDQDVFINVAGGLTLSEPAADLPLCMAVASSLWNKSCGSDVAVFGEVGLSGELRAVAQAQRRLSECARLGFGVCILPKENVSGLSVPQGLRLLPADTLPEALAKLPG